jgi:RNA polymerase II subunit A C-terminal domain phosphatase
MWLFECFSRWLRVDEDDFLIPVEDDDRRPVTSLPAEGADGEEGPPLSEDDEVAITSAAANAATIELGGAGGRLIVKTKDLMKNGVDDGRLANDDDDDDLPESPIEEMLDEIDWNEFDDEMNEFLDSEGTQDSEAEDEAPISINKNNPSTNDVAEPSLPARKRKLSAMENEPAAAAAETPDRPGSRLEQRKKRAFERTTSLTHMATAEHSSGLPSPEATTGEEAEEAEERDGDGEEKRRKKDEDDDAEAEAEEDAEMEREMMAAFEDDDDDDGGEDIGDGG